MSPSAVDPDVELVASRAAAVSDLDGLALLARGCVACPELVASRTTVVVGDFPDRARLLLVGEAPGATEDQVGRPFVGRAGQLLEQVLSEVGIDRGAVAVANVVKCRPPGNRAPRRAEAKRCRGWLDRQLELLDPSLVVTLGGTALAWALGPGLRLGAMRERVHPWRDRGLLVTYHPSAALRFGPAGMPLAALREDLAMAGALTCPS